MEELYRMLLIRPAEAVQESQGEPPSTVIDLRQESAFQDALRQADNQAERAAVATDFSDTDHFVSDLSHLENGKFISGVASAFDDVPVVEVMPTGAVVDIIAQVLGDAESASAEQIRELTGTDGWQADRARLTDSIIAIREARQLHRIGVAELAVGRRAMALIETAVTTNSDTIAPSRHLRATLYIGERRPNEERLPLQDKEILASEEAEAETRRAIELVERTIEFLAQVPRDSLESRLETSAQVVEEQTARKKSRSRGPLVGLISLLGVEMDEVDADSAPTAVTSRSDQRLFLSPAIVDWAPEEIRQVLLDEAIDPAQTSVEMAIKTLELRRHTLATSERVSRTTHYRRGTRIQFTDYDVALPEPPVDAESIGLPPKNLAPRGCALPVGVGELLAIRQQLKCYEGGDVAHIENVLEGESKRRAHRRKRTTEDFFLTATEVEKSDERETQTTSRFELASEVQETIEEELKTDAGVKVTSYGPSVKVNAHANFAYSNAREESRQQATKMSKETVEKAATKYTEKVRQESSRKIIEEIEEINKHKLSAEDKDHHIIGIYQWLNKRYEAQVYNYGLRSMYEFMVPEPAAYYIWALGKKADAEAPDLVPPPDFNVTPSTITEGSYKGLVAKFEAEGVNPPPETFTTVEINKSGNGGGDKEVADSDSVTIPAGYEFYSQYYSYWYKYTKNDHHFELRIGDGFDDPGSVPIHVFGRNVKNWSCYVHIRCRRTAAAMDNWRSNTWDALYRGHLQQVAVYEEKLANLINQEPGTEIAGRNPLINRKVEREELRKHSISLLAGVPPVWLDGIQETPFGPFPTCSGATEHGPYVRFLEQAFEWQNMTYIFYPYYWARLAKWQELFGIEDTDPVFEEFLRAGYARVVVPVREGFEPAVEHFRQTGEIWAGGDLPTITDPDYLPIVEELKERLQAPGDEEAVGDPWDVMVPTQLVKLRPDNDLPKWEKQADGTWVEVNPG